MYPKIVVFIALSLQLNFGFAKEVLLSHKGLVLNAELELVPGKTLADGVILITHGGLAHRNMETLINLRTLLHDSGYNTFAINLSLGISNRRGMYDCQLTHRHTNEDAIAEMDLWIDWLQQQGAKNIGLLGHSRGGAQTALFVADGNKTAVRFVLLLAPATKENGAEGYDRRYGQKLAPLLSRAQQLVNEDKGEYALGHVNMMFCRNTKVSAESFVSYYTPSPRLDTPSLLPKIKKPTLIVIAGDDEVVIGLDKKLMTLPSQKYVNIKTIEGSDHFFRDLNMDEVVEEIDAFVTGLSQ